MCRILSARTLRMISLLPPAMVAPNEDMYISIGSVGYVLVAVRVKLSAEPLRPHHEIANLLHQRRVDDLDVNHRFGGGWRVRLAFPTTVGAATAGNPASRRIGAQSLASFRNS